MNDMSAVIVPKSDQISADDFLAGPRTFTIEAVAISPGTEQPVSISLAGENRVWRPCKSMSRVLVSGWGPDAKVYVGRAVTLYRDPTVKWGGMAVGGIRVSHMSHIERDLALNLTATKGKRAPHAVKVLEAPADAPKEDAQAKWAADFIAKVRAAADVEALDLLVSKQRKWVDILKDDRPELHVECEHAITTAREGLTFTPEGPADEDRGESHTD